MSGDLKEFFQTRTGQRILNSLDELSNISLELKRIRTLLEEEAHAREKIAGKEIPHDGG